MITIAIIGAAGNMGLRACDRLGSKSDYRLLCVDVHEDACQELRKRGMEVASMSDAVEQADVVLLAVPDVLVGSVAGDVVPAMRSRSMIICLDPAAPHAGRLPLREDLAYFITHPAHPPVFNDEQEMAHRRDFFGSGLAKQSIVSALAQGTEEDYAKGEAISQHMFGPILRSHRVTVEQMALLEPALSETLAATCLGVIREGLDIVIEKGVPPEAARDFLLGHINIELAIFFQEIDWDFSTGAKAAMEAARARLFRDDWKGIFSPEELRESVHRITEPQESSRSPR